MHRLALLIFSALIFVNKKVPAQTAAADSAFLIKAKLYSRQTLFQNAQETVPLYQGKEFVQYGQMIKGTPFFLYSKPEKGNLEYNHVFYADITLAYDMIADKVIIRDYSNPYLMIAPTEKINYFKLGEHIFFRPEADIRYQGLSDTGFYEIIYPGRSMVVAKKWKQVQYLQGEEIPYAFMSFEKYYMYDQKTFREVNSRNDLHSIFKGKEKEMKKIIRSQDLNFKKNKEQSLIQSASYFDQLNK